MISISVNLQKDFVELFNNKTNRLYITVDKAYINIDAIQPEGEVDDTFATTKYTDDNTEEAVETDNGFWNYITPIIVLILLCIGLLCIIFICKTIKARYNQQKHLEALRQILN